MSVAVLNRPRVLLRALSLLPAMAAAGSSAAGEPGWLYYGGDQGGRHFSPATQINRDNVADLEVAWVHRSGDMATYGEEMAKTSTQSTPILLPIVLQMGYSSLWFGIVMAIACEIGTETPPVGLNLFVIKGVSPPSVSLMDIIRGAIPFALVETVGLIIFIVFPGLVLWLPNLVK